MKTSSNFLINFAFLQILLAILPITIHHAAAAAQSPTPTAIAYDPLPRLRNPFEKGPSPWKPAELKWPETYIEPTLKYGLNLVLPQTYRKGLNVDAGYDRWEGLPTLKVDYFQPIKGWNDKSLFLTPRFSLGSRQERLSLGAGFRHLMTTESMIGFHAFSEWVRPRREHTDFLKQVGVGFELAALPGNYSDISVTVNAYLPLNERTTVAEDSNMLVREKLPTGLDARLGFLLPAFVDWLDLRMDASVYSYRGDVTDLTGHKASLTASTRDGMLTAVLGHDADSRRGENFRIEGSVNVVFDWNALINGEVPFSAPYKPLTTRYNRKIRDCLYDRVWRKHDLPTDRTKTRLALVTSVSDRTVFFEGGFPNLPNSRVTVQVSQSPWRDELEVLTDASGRYMGKLNLKPGTYRFRLIHKPSGKVSDVKVVAVGRQAAGK